MGTRYTGTTDNDTINAVRNGAGGNYGDCITVGPDGSPIHVYAKEGADTIRIGFDSISSSTELHPF